MSSTDAPPTAPAAAQPSVWRAAHDLLASMRFAIALLCVLGIASIIGTVVQQGEPLNNYINEFGPFWAELLGTLGLFSVYSAPWFLLILAFLVVSTSFCIARNAPRFIADWSRFNEGLRESSLSAFHHHASAPTPHAPAQAVEHVHGTLKADGWTMKVQARDSGTMIAARKGRLSKIGYIAAHSAIVLICLAALADGDLMIRLQMWLHGKQLYTGSTSVSQVPSRYRLDADNPTFRANLFVPEGARSGTAVISMPRGIILQELPFDVELKHFIVEYYPTGQPRQFASEVVFHDHDSGRQTATTIKVNEPAQHRGITLYQSSFEDGGSRLWLNALPLQAHTQPFAVQGRVGDALPLAGQSNAAIQLELTDFRAINVENLNADTVGTDARTVNLVDSLQTHLGSGAARADASKQLHNIGPSIKYKLVDAAGQRREYHHYMNPVQLDGRSVFLFGVRADASEPSFSYLRVPADEDASLAGWQRLRTALLDPALRAQAAASYARATTPTDSQPQMRSQLQTTAERALALFAGADSAAAASAAAGASATARDMRNGTQAGLAALSDFIEANVPTAERERMAQVLLRVLQGSLAELNDIARQAQQLPELPMDEAGRSFIEQSILALSDSFYYPAPFLLTLDRFEQVQASVLQVTRAPGRTVVYLGAVLLIVGVFAMLYLRDRRLWVWVTPANGQQSHISLALATPRRTLDTDAEFEWLKTQLWSQAR